MQPLCLNSMCITLNLERKQLFCSHFSVKIVVVPITEFCLFNCTLQLLKAEHNAVLCPPQRANPLSNFVHFRNSLFSINYVTVLSVSVNQVLNCGYKQGQLTPKGNFKTVH